MIALDTNVVLQLLAHDEPAQLAALNRFLATHADETFFVPDIVLVETVWTLRAAFGWDRTHIAAALRRLAAKPDVEFADRDQVDAACRALAGGHDFADALIVSTARAHGCTALASFDLDLARHEPEFVVPPK